MTTTAGTAGESIPQDGNLVEVGEQRWVVSESAPGGDGSTLLILRSVEDGHYGESSSRLRNVARNLILDFATFRWTGQFGRHVEENCPLPSDLSQRQVADLQWLGLIGTALCRCGRRSAR